MVVYKKNDVFKCECTNIDTASKFVCTLSSSGLIVSIAQFHSETSELNTAKSADVVHFYLFLRKLL